MEETSIKTIFFDLGRVIVDFNHLQIAEKLLSSRKHTDSLNPQKIFNHLFHPIHGLCNTYDAGKITSAEFHAELCREFDLTLSFESFVPIWTEIFSENRGVVEIIEELKKHFRLYLISNTNPLHFDYILIKFPVLNLFETWFLSYKLGFCKPDTRIFETALSQTGTTADHAVYIDDILEFVEASQKIGMHGVHFTTAESLKHRLTDLLPFKFGKN